MSYYLLSHPLYKNDNSDIIISPEIKEFLDKIYEYQQILNELHCNGFIETKLEYYSVRLHSNDIGDPTYIRPMIKHELEKGIYKYYFAKIYAIGDNEFLYFGNCANQWGISHCIDFKTNGKPWVFVVAKEDDFIRYRPEKFKTYKTLNKFLNTRSDYLMTALKNLNIELPSYLQSSNTIMMIKNITRHFQNEIGSQCYEDAKHDFELRCVPDE